MNVPHLLYRLCHVLEDEMWVEGVELVHLQEVGEDPRRVAASPEEQHPEGRDETQG